MAVLGSPSLIVRKVSVDVKKTKCYFQGSGAVWKWRWMSLIVRTVSADVKQHLKKRCYLSIAEFKSCVKGEVDVLGSPSLIARTVSVDVKQKKQKQTNKKTRQSSGAVWKSRWMSWAPLP